MDLFLDISRGAGLAGAAGVRPLVAVLVAGFLGQADLGVDFSDTSYAFIESWPFIVIVAVAAMITTVLHSLAANVRSRAVTTVTPVLTATAMVAGAILFAASVAGDDHGSWLGIVAGAAVGLFTRTAAAAIFGGAERRLPEQRFPWSLWAVSAAAAAGIATVAVALPPTSYLVLVACGWILIARRRRDSEKYAGLRVLR